MTDANTKTLLVLNVVFNSEQTVDGMLELIETTLKEAIPEHDPEVEYVDDFEIQTTRRPDDKLITFSGVAGPAF